ncbi:MAG TPA: hypothetical protein VN673_08320, partial [Clostridia bacterium]|nr:hypothetical protein [Clostridia bacterium]
MNNKVYIVPFALAAIVLTLFTLRRNLSGPAMNLRPSTALGEVLAEETARLVGRTGKVVAIGRASARDEKSSGGEQITSFASAITRHGSLKLAETEWLPRAPVGTMDLGGAT